MHLQALITLAGPALQLAIAAISVCQTADDWARAMNNQQNPVFQDPTLTEPLQQLSPALLFCVDALEQGRTRISRMALNSIHMLNILWLKACSDEAACKIHPICTCMSYERGCLSGEALGKLIKDVTGGKFLHPQWNIPKKPFS